MEEPMTHPTPRTVDAIIVGAGFAGLYMLHRLRGLGLSARVFEAGGGVGGTWYWNRYPGARCDIESLEYSYQFSEELQMDWTWTERYATQPEILRYIEHVAERFDLLGDVTFNTRVNAAHFDDEAGLWRIETSAGEQLAAKFCVMATGCLSSANLPGIPGTEAFAGAIYHTGKWPHEGVDFTGQRVAVIGTGSSAIQSIPHIAAQASELIIFQRTPNYSIPAHNRPLTAEEQENFRAQWRELRAANKQMPFGFGARYGASGRLAAETSPEEQLAAYEQRWQLGGLPFMGTFADLLFNTSANATAARFVREKIQAAVRDPWVAEALSPQTIVGCKRLCVDTGYYDTFNQPHVRLVDINLSPIEEITPHGIRTTMETFAVDALVFATGFDAMTGALSKIDIRGAGGVRLADKWAEGPRAYLGLATAGFPNLFMITGPGSPSVLSNMLPSIEQHVDWIADCIAYMQNRQLYRIDPTTEAEEAWVAHVNEIADLTLMRGCNSWYLGANVPGKPRVFMPYIGFPMYIEKCNDVAAKGYEGFVLGERETV
jgi:cation diffusion facilitator CzcD-associated flavoprotein CzcO